MKPEPAIRSLSLYQKHRSLYIYLRVCGYVKEKIIHIDFIGSFRD
jgi:hypothetical protein